MCIICLFVDNFGYIIIILDLWIIKCKIFEKLC